MRAVGGILLGLLLAVPPAAAQDVYRIDPVHSEVSFKVGHLMSKTSGRFTRFKGTLKVDPANPGRSSVDVTIDAASITTDHDARDKHLKSKDFFDVETFPAVTFRSTSVKDLGKGRLEVTGDFTLHGVTRRVTFPVTSAGTQPGMQAGTVVIGFTDGALSLNRSDYGIRTMPGIIGDTVVVALNIEAIKVQATR